MAYHWPGNVRELDNVVERAMILCRNNILTFDQFETAGQQGSIFGDNMDIDPLNIVVIRHIELALKKSNGKIHGAKGAATMLKINASTLRNRMKKLGISYQKKIIAG